MAIYRGPGGPGDATADSANTAQLAEEFAQDAADSATAAANSATSAASSATNASASESSAATSASAALASETAAAISETAAGTSATNAATSASSASTSATNAAASETAAASSATAAASSASSASTSASNASTSALAAAVSETAAATSETNAAASEAAAAISETNAATSETNAAASASSASTSETNAANSATSAAASASAASTSETNAANSASAASTSATNAATSETNAANSATAAATSATNAATSETNAASSASSAATSATNAAASESAAATSETNAAASASAALTSETNAAASATSAASSASAAATSETNAAASEAAASTSETNAAASESAAATSETNAAASALAASTSETNAATSETNAASSATAAAASASAASTSETNAAASETAAAASASAAATSETNAATSATNAAASETAAATSASNALTSETNAATSETNAANSASAAATSEANAASSASAAATSASNAETAYDNFDDRYLGDKASDPTLDNDGNALLTGALYWNTTDNELKVYTGSVWSSLGAGGNPFNQNLNTTDSVTFAGLNTTSYARLGGGNSSPFSIFFSHTIAGVGTNRVVNFDGSGAVPSVWWTNGSRAYGAIDAQDPGLTFWANNGSSWQKQMTMNYGNITIDTDIRSPIFYDSNNTAYYVDPSSGGFNMVGGTSNRVTFVTNDSGFRVSNAEGNGVVDVRLGAAWGRPGVYSNSYLSLGSSGTYTEFIFDNVQYGYINNAGVMQVTGSHRAPIFYDSNNTGYYADLASRTYTYAWTTDGRNYNREWIQMDNYTGLYSPLNNAHFYPNNVTYGSWRILGSRNGWIGLHFETYMTLMMNDNACGVHREGSGWRYYVEGTNLYCNGQIQAYWSDRRLKENFRPIKSESLDILSKMTAYRFNWNKKVEELGLEIKVGKEEISLIAQDVQEILPDAVAVNKAGASPNAKEGEFDYLTIKYDRITPIVVQAINELRERIERLEKV